jgi:peptidoglycan hydrolase CwlO-like protein
MVTILTVICIILLSVLVVSSSSNGLKLKKAQAEITVLSNTVAQKDAEMVRITGLLQETKKALDTANKEMEKVKTDLSNTVLRLQAMPVMQPPAQTAVPVAQASVVKKK